MPEALNDLVFGGSSQQHSGVQAGISLPQSASKPFFRRPLAVAMVLLGSALTTSSAYGQSASDPAAAQALFEKGLEYLEKENWAQACPQFEASMKLDPSVGAQINIARCQEHDGKVALAWASFKKARTMNKETPSAKRRADIDKFLDESIARLEQRIPYVAVKVTIAGGGELPADLKLSRDGIEQPLVGSEAVPTDPGKHVYEVSARGYKTAKREIQLAEAQRIDVELVLEIDPDAGKPSPNQDTSKDTPPKSDGEAGLANTPSPHPDSQNGPSPLLISGLVIGGIGVLGLVAAGVTGGLAVAERDGLDELIESNRCVDNGGTLSCFDEASTTAANDHIESGKTLSLASTISVFAGAAFAATGIALVIAAAVAGDDKAKTGVLVTPVLSPTRDGQIGMMGLVVGGPL